MKAQNFITLTGRLALLLLIVGSTASLAFWLSIPNLTEMRAGGVSLEEVIVAEERVTNFGIAVLVTVIGTFIMLSSSTANLIMQGKSADMKVYKTPGAKCLAFTDTFCSPRTVEKIFRPLIADWHYEYFDALKAKCLWKARWISVRYRWAFLMALGPSRLWSVIEKIAGIAKG